MKTWKLVSGILSMVLFAVIEFQSCAAGVVNALEDNGGSSGTVGFLCGILMLVGGIVSVASRKSEGKGGNIALIIIFGLTALIGFAGYGNYSDLIVWSVWAAINAVLAIVALITSKKKVNSIADSSEQQ